jgi:cytochrome c biogenesis protein CcmG, thiol:disulfide interchange protein DsbE
MLFRSIVAPAFLCVASVALRAQPPGDSSQLGKTLAALAKRCDHPQQYSWQGELTIEAREGDGAFLPVASAKAELAISEEGKSLLKIDPSGGEEYWLISDGKKTWSYLPAKKQYMVEELASLSSGGDEQQQQGGGEEGETLVGQYARNAVTNVSEFLKHAKQIGSTKTAALKFGKEKVNWPVFQILDKPEDNGNQIIAELTMAPDQPVLGHMAWLEIRPKDGKTVTIRTNLQFSSFSAGEPVPDELFTFEPPKKAKQVEELVFPGQSGSALVNHPSPEFEAKTINGEKVRLRDLRGKVVMLSFWASWCPPCREELPAVAKLYGEFKDKGLTVYGVNDEDSGIARKYLEKAGLTLPTIDDNSQKASRLYHVTSIPTVFLIDGNGKVIKRLRGGHSEEALRTALKSAGIGNE